jgi:hypothetical protein
MNMFLGAMCAYCGGPVHFGDCRAEKQGNRVTMNQTKPSNPKDSLGIKKVPFHVIPQQVLGEVGLALMEGARKYGSYNFREKSMGVKAMVYVDALWRHVSAYVEGQETDPDSGLPHIVKAITCLIVLRDAQLNGMCEDDRPIKVVNQDWQVRLNELAAGLIERYPEPKLPFTEKANGKSLDQG